MEKGERWRQVTRLIKEKGEDEWKKRSEKRWKWERFKQEVMSEK